MTTEQVETLPSSIPAEVVPNRTKCPYGCKSSINPDELKQHQQECFGKVARLPVLAEYSHILKFKIDGYQFMVVLPREYNDTKRPNFYPALLFLHGRGEQGYNFEKMNNISIFKTFTNESFPFITVIPQSPRGEAGWLVKKLNKIMKFVMQEFRVDQNRVYGTGLAMGAYGLMKFAATYPEMFAALVPVCGGIDISIAPKLTHIPIWATHTDNDSIVPVSTSVNMIKAISLAGSQDNKLTIFEPYQFRLPFEDHDAWTETYENPQIYLWMLSHTKGTENSQVEHFKEAINKLTISQRVRVKFIIEHKVHWQEQMAVVGSVPELGSWNTSEAVKMYWNEGNVWSVEVVVPKKYSRFEWKFVILKNNDAVWESRHNRELHFNEECHVTLNNKWNEW